MCLIKSYASDRIGEICGFPHSLDPAVLIDFGALNTSQISLQSLVYALPEDYVLHVVGTRSGKSLIHYKEQREIVLNDLRRHVGELPVLKQLSAEIDAGLDLFCEVSGDAYPMISLRIVTADYLRREAPSVSEKYHRDSTSLTLTKCFFGSGAVYTDESNIRRSFFHHSSIAFRNEDALFDPTREYTIPDETWILLKGEIWEGIDARSQSLIDYVLGPQTRLASVFKGHGFIHRGGNLVSTPRRFIFNVNTWKTEFFSGRY